MDTTLKKIIAVLASLFILSILYYGTYLPLQKSTAFINAMQNTGNVKSLEAFESLLATPLDMPSPVGQEELARNSASSILGTIQQVSDTQVIDELNKFINHYYDPIIARGKGMSFNQDLYLEGALNEVSFVRTQNPAYLSLAEKYYSELVAAAPNRPQGLYGLFDIYRMEGNVSQVNVTGQQILSLWPTDVQTRNSLAQFLTQQSTTTKKVVK